MVARACTPRKSGLGAIRERGRSAAARLRGALKSGRRNIHRPPRRRMGDASRPVCTKNLNPDVVMVKSTKYRV
jgi:hypothetical protein